MGEGAVAGRSLPVLSGPSDLSEAPPSGFGGPCKNPSPASS